MLRLPVLYLLCFIIVSSFFFLYIYFKLYFPIKMKLNKNEKCYLSTIAETECVFLYHKVNNITFLILKVFLVTNDFIHVFSCFS